MPLFKVLIQEVHISYRMVEADSSGEAKEKAAECEEYDLEFSHTLDTETWSVVGPLLTEATDEVVEEVAKNDDETN
jgi:hypothetical protein